MMERLTGKDELGYYMPCDVTLNCLKHRGECVDRLGAYEDTGLTPERCAELAEADRDGRLVVLPMTERLIVPDYDAVRKTFNEEFKATRKLIENGETRLDNLAEGFTEADRVLRRMCLVDAVDREQKYKKEG